VMGPVFLTSPVERILLSLVSLTIGIRKFGIM
jgi:hypothetical protein